MTTSSHSKLFFGLAWVTLLAAIGLVSLVTYWLVWPAPGLTGLPGRIPIQTHEVSPGDVLKYTVDYCTTASLPMAINVTRELRQLDGEKLVFPLPPELGYQVLQPCEIRNIAVGLGVYFPPGKYQIHYLVTTYPNPLRVVRQTFVSEEFTILPFDRGRLPAVHPPLPEQQN